jgi:hypothetical protein
VCVRVTLCGLLGLPIGVWFEKRDLDEKEKMNEISFHPPREKSNFP